MNALRTFVERRSLTTVALPPSRQAQPIRHVHRERDFGVGYGNSSGYASNRRYTSDWAQPRFRFS